MTAGGREAAAPVQSVRKIADAERKKFLKMMKEPTGGRGGDLMCEEDTSLYQNDERHEAVMKHGVACYRPRSGVAPKTFSSGRRIRNNPPKKTSHRVFV